MLWIYAAVLVFCVLAVATALIKSYTLGLGLLVTEGLAVLLMRILGGRARTTLSDAEQASLPAPMARTGT